MTSTPTYPLPLDVDTLLSSEPGAARPVSVQPLPDSPAPAAAGATHRFGLPVPEAVFMSYDYLAGTLDVVEAPIQIMRYDGFRDWAKRTFGHGGKPAEVVRETARLSSVAKAKRRALRGKQHVWDYYASRQAYRDAGLPVGPQNPPATRLSAKDATTRADEQPVDPRDLGPNEDYRWWLRWPGESAAAWSQRVDNMPRPATAEVIAHGMPRNDPATAQVKREAALLRLRATDARRDARRAAKDEAKAATAPADSAAPANTRTLTREEDVARRLALPLAERVAEDLAAMAKAGRTAIPMPYTMARIAAGQL